MSSRPLLLFMALMSILVLPGSATQAPAASGDPIADLLAQDDIPKAEALVRSAPPSAKTSAYQGEIEFRKGHFDGAQSLYQAALRTDDKTPRAHFGMGKLALAKLKTKDALRSFRRAIELDPKEPLYHFYASEAADLDKDPAEMRKQLEEYVRLAPKDPDRLTEAKAGLEMLAAFKDQKIGVVEAPDQPKPIPFRKLINLIFADIMINGQGPFNFAIDTGASQMVVSERVAQKIGLKPITTTIMMGAGGSGKVESPVYRLDQIQIGDVKIKNLPAGAFNDPLLSQVTDGIIGASLLADFIVTVNYPENRIELSHRNTNTGEPTPVWCFANLLLLPLDINGQQGNFVIDTGAVTTVVSHGLANALGVNENTPGAKVDLGIGGVGGFAGVVLLVPKVTLKGANHSEAFDRVLGIDLQPISKMLQTEVAGLVGFDFLEKYKLTLDYYKAEVRLSK
jgi:predicted aspartyl protease